MQSKVRISHDQNAKYFRTTSQACCQLFINDAITFDVLVDGVADVHFDGDDTDVYVGHNVYDSF